MGISKIPVAHHHSCDVIMCSTIVADRVSTAGQELCDHTRVIWTGQYDGLLLNRGVHRHHRRLSRSPQSLPVLPVVVESAHCVVVYRRPSGTCLEGLRSA